MSIVITGGSGGLAGALADKLSASAEVCAPGRVELDVTDVESVKAYFSQLEKIDLLICNAGLTEDGLLLKMTESSWDSVMEVNLKGSFLCAQQAVSKMLKARAGHIVFIGSHSGFIPPVGQANYAAAKAGLVGFAKSLAREVGARGVRVNVVVPGWMETKMTAKISESAREAALANHVLDQFNTPEAVAEFVETLHYKMPFTSGQVFHLDSRVLAY